MNGQSLPATTDLVFFVGPETTIGTFTVTGASLSLVISAHSALCRAV